MNDVKALRDIASRIEASGESVPDDRLAARMAENARALRTVAGDLESAVETGVIAVRPR
ncbi:hypothetical protein GJW-30_1_02040 [Variibacter gotjawalensis]|uniref:Uncharacterized protein n=1 Tax=Variibacter gotjawalensis TaxID=1333996 RepID=A0A0S3PUE2_9BRAD|nr:hypothetical protein [Variibacter gotjawalensis]NIK49831.1 hypothetical protein [Variibacter gotjawalensis]RZS45831.1 hypothetical protein EV661_4157 [Variibacter gotjawalensis]BAT59507.1 hypothetical protein GJW-30_1_02040 [Variibacter gotjawalensis]